MPPSDSLPEQPRGSTRKKILQNLAIVAGSIILALLLLEIGARFLPPPFEDTTNAAEACWSPTGWRGKAHFETIVDTEGYVHNLHLNSLGMHDTEHTWVKPDDTYRILMLGDSFVHAIQIKEAETAHQRLEDLLNDDGAQRFEVISAGVSGWGTGQQLQYYRTEGRNFEPDLVLLMMFLDNDVKDNLPGRGITVNGVNCYAPYFVLNNNHLDPVPWHYVPGIAPAANQSSGFKKGLTTALAVIYSHSRLYAQLEPLLAPDPIEASMLDFYIGQNPTFDYALELTYALVDQLRQEVKADGAEFGVVLISPLSLVEFTQMNAEQREAVYQRIPALRRAEEIDPPNQTIAAQLAGKGTPVLDLLPVFLRHTDESPYFFSLDKHWNAQGNNLAAETIYQWLTENPSLLQN